MTLHEVIEAIKHHNNYIKGTESDPVEPSVLKEALDLATDTLECTLQEDEELYKMELEEGISKERTLYELITKSLELASHYNERRQFEISKSILTGALDLLRAHVFVSDETKKIKERKKNNGTGGEQ